MVIVRVVTNIFTMAYINTPITSKREEGQLRALKAGRKVDAVVRELASHQCIPSSISGPGVICGLSLLLVLYSAP